MWKSFVILAVAVGVASGAGRGMLALESWSHAHPKPSPAAAAAPEGVANAGSAVVTKAADGHYWAEAKVDGRAVRFLVDTGATAVALTTEDARRVGLDPAHLSFDHEVATASGPSRAALVELGYVQVSGARVERVPAFVLEKGLSASLLGMSYLGRLSRFEATPSAMILRP